MEMKNRILLHPWILSVAKTLKRQKLAEWESEVRGVLGRGGRRWGGLWGSFCVLYVFLDTLYARRKT